MDPFDEPGPCNVVLHTTGTGSHGRRILKNLSSIVAVFYIILTHNTPSATALSSRWFTRDEIEFAVNSKAMQATECKAIRARKTSRALSNITFSGRERFPADVSPGQEKQPMFWFKDKYHSFFSASDHSANTARGAPKSKNPKILKYAKWICSEKKKLRGTRCKCF